MCFRKQSRVNLDIALCLNDLNDENMGKLSKMSKQELASIIINRLYYGVFLMAKELVQIDEEARDSHIQFWNKVCDYMIDRRISKKHDEYILNDFFSDITTLKDMRVVYDYRNQAYLNEESKAIEEIGECFQLKDKIYETLKRYISEKGDNSEAINQR